jgi:hypothetical protein
VGTEIDNRAGTAAATLAELTRSYDVGKEARFHESRCERFMTLPGAPTLEGSATASPWVPLWRIIERIASAIGDSQELEHYARTRLCIRQAALNGRLRIRGRHEIESAGQDRTNFSDVYTVVPAVYWKHSVINFLATGATYESDRHTGPETVYAWGPKGLNETNCYTGLQLNSDDVSQLIGDVKGTGFSSDAPMSEKEEWISAASAQHLLGRRTICKRAHAGLIRARADRFICDGRSADNIDVPVKFWWAEGGRALDQNWTTGDFDTWIDHIHLQAFGVTFWRPDIERSKPTPLAENATSPASMTAKALEEVGPATNPSIQTGYAFLAMPIDSDDHQLVDVLEAIKAAATDCGIIAERVDEVESNERITDRILESITKAEFVIVDLTKERPNVFFEAGFAHGSGKVPIYVARAGTTIHFDIKDYPIIMFRNMRELKDGITKRLRALTEVRTER